MKPRAKFLMLGMAALMVSTAQAEDSILTLHETCVTQGRPALCAPKCSPAIASTPPTTSAN